MSLYAYEEVCRGCAFAMWFFNPRKGDRFLYCGEGNEDAVSAIQGICIYKKPASEEQERNNHLKVSTNV